MLPIYLLNHLWKQLLKDPESFNPFFLYSSALLCLHSPPPYPFWIQDDWIAVLSLDKSTALEGPGLCDLHSCAHLVEYCYMQVVWGKYDFMIITLNASSMLTLSCCFCVGSSFFHLLHGPHISFLELPLKTLPQIHCKNKNQLREHHQPFLPNFHVCIIFSFPDIMEICFSFLQGLIFPHVLWTLFPLILSKTLLGYFLSFM